MSQELSSLGLSSPCIEASSPGRAGLNTVSALNAMYELLQIHRRNMCTVEELEKEHLKKSSSLEHMQMNNSRLKACLTGSSSEYLQTIICVCQRCSIRLFNNQGMLNKHTILCAVNFLIPFLQKVIIRILQHYKKQKRSRQTCW